MHKGEREHKEQKGQSEAVGMQAKGGGKWSEVVGM